MICFHIKRPLALLLALVMLASIFSATALAADDESDMTTSERAAEQEDEHAHDDAISKSGEGETSEEQPSPETVPAEQEPTAPTSGMIPNSSIGWELTDGMLLITGSGGCETFTCADDQPWAAVREQITEVWFDDPSTLSIPLKALPTGLTAAPRLPQPKCLTPRR